MNSINSNENGINDINDINDDNGNNNDKSLVHSEQYLNSFCIQENDFNLIKMNSIQLIKINMELYANLEKQFMKRIENVYYILKYNNQMIQ